MDKFIKLTASHGEIKGEERTATIYLNLAHITSIEEMAGPVYKENMTGFAKKEKIKYFGTFVRTTSLINNNMYIVKESIDEIFDKIREIEAIY